MNNTGKIQKIAGWVALTGIVVFLIYEGLWVYDGFCGLNLNPTGIFGAVCDFDYGMGYTIKHTIYLTGIILTVGGGVVWILRVFQKNKSESLIS